MKRLLCFPALLLFFCLTLLTETKGMMSLADPSTVFPNLTAAETTLQNLLLKSFDCRIF